MHHKHVIATSDVEFRIETHPDWGVVIAVKSGDGPETVAHVAKTVAFAIHRAVEAIAYDADESHDW